jgi:hypothetical protein
MDEDAMHGPSKSEIAMAAHATIELFGNGAIAKTKERLWEVEADGRPETVQYRRLRLEEVTRLHKGRHKY